jgi:cellulose synthase/poly-beta-1,6-N-acetylglucosamine synthase-like glycosyltransferase
MKVKKISVAIPCRNEVKNIENCVRSILNSNYPNIDVTVVDGMSDDGTREVLEKLSIEFSNVKMVDNPHQLTPYAFNLGVKNSDGFYLQIVGSRNTLEPDYLPLLVKKLEDNPQVACVGGDYQHSYENETAKYISWAMESKFGVGGNNYRTMKESCEVDTVGVPMYRRSIFDELGYFDERLTRNQDDDFNFRVSQAGHKIFYVAEAKCKYYVRGSFPKLFRQMSQYGYFKVFVNKKHGTITSLRQLVPMLFVNFLVIFGLAGLLVPALYKLMAITLALYLTLGFLSSLQFSKNPLSILKIQWAIFCMHIGYGSGYMKGFFHFIILNRSPSNSMQKLTT